MTCGAKLGVRRCELPTDHDDGCRDSHDETRAVAHGLQRTVDMQAERIEALTEQLSCVQAEHSLDKARLGELDEFYAAAQGYTEGTPVDVLEKLRIAEVNRLALQRERDELLIKLQGAERAYDKLRVRFEETIRG